jgi:hypothetical protein
VSESTEVALRRLSALVGEWTTASTHPAVPGTVVHGRATSEWLEGERFLIWRERADHPDFPDAIAIIGDTDGLQAHSSTRAVSIASWRSGSATRLGST